MTETHEDAQLIDTSWVLSVICYETLGFGRLVRTTKVVSNFDPHEVLNSASGKVVAFTFCRELVTHVRADGKVRETRSGLLTPDDGPTVFYFINVRKVASRKSLARWWRFGRRDPAKFEAMDNRGADYVVSWWHGIHLGYVKGRDFLLNR